MTHQQDVYKRQLDPQARPAPLVPPGLPARQEPLVLQVTLALLVRLGLPAKLVPLVRPAQQGPLPRSLLVP